MTITINALGWACPKPIVEAKKELDKHEEATITIWVDDPLALANLKDYAEENNLDFSYTSSGAKEHHITLVKKAGNAAAVTNNSNLVILITTNILGQGSEELGLNLMKGYLYALSEVTPKPKTIIFMNGGVHLTTQGTTAEESLLTLEAAGVEIISCGACLNFYGLEDKLVVGKVGNMYTFAEKTNKAANTIVI